MRDEWQRRLAEQASRHIRATQASFEQAEMWLDETHPDLSDQHKRDIATGAVDIYMERLRRNQAPGNAPAIDPTFRDEGWQRPGSVLVTVQFSGPDGAQRYRSYRIPAAQDATLDDVLQEAMRLAESRQAEYEGFEATNVIF